MQTLGAYTGAYFFGNCATLPSHTYYTVIGHTPTSVYITEVIGMEKAAATLAPKIKIRKRVFLGEFKIEDYLQKEVVLLLEKSK